MRPNPLDRYRTDGMESLSPQRLLVLLYQRLAADLDAAMVAARAVPVQAAAAHHALVHAQDIVSELALALDADAWPGALPLAEIYRYLEQLLVEANVTKSPETIEQCRQLVLPLVEAWAEAYRLVTVERTDAIGRVLA